MGLYNEASLIMYPSGYKSGKIYCQKPTDGSGDLTFTRASTATRVNPSGLIESVASGVPRIDFTGGGCGKLLSEPQRTNKALWNRDMTNAVWSGIAAGTGIAPVVTSNYAVSPSGDTDADRVVFNAGAGTTSADASILRQNTTLTNGLQYGYSVWLKSTNGTDQKIKLRINSTLPFAEVTVTNEWVRYSGLSTGSVTGSRDFGLDLRGDFAASADLLVWGFQLEEDVSYITSLIPTAGSTVTRVADTSITIGLSSVINSVEGVLYAHWKMFANNLTNRFIAISDGTNNNRVFIGYSNVSNRLDVYVVSGGVMQAAMNYTLTDITVFHKIAIKYKANDFALWVNGVERATDVSGSTFASGTLNSFRLNEGVTISPFYGYIQDLGLFDVSTDLAELTTL